MAITKNEFMTVLAELSQDELIHMYLTAKENKKSVFEMESEKKKQIEQDMKNFKPR